MGIIVLGKRQFKFCCVGHPGSCGGCGEGRERSQVFEQIPESPPAGGVVPDSASYIGGGGKEEGSSGIGRDL
jgi:hypothetical protein